jgi:hypothetical protein
VEDAIEWVLACIGKSEWDNGMEEEQLVVRFSVQLTVAADSSGRASRSWLLWLLPHEPPLLVLARQAG